MPKKTPTENQTSRREPARPWDHRPNGKQTALLYWREANPGKPDPDDDGLHQFFADRERESAIEYWREANPGKPIPDDYAVLRRWYINEVNIDRAMFVSAMMRERGEKKH